MGILRSEEPFVLLRIHFLCKRFIVEPFSPDFGTPVLRLRVQDVFVNSMTTTFPKSDQQYVYYVTIPYAMHLTHE